MGVVLLRAGAYAKAEEQYRAALQVAPDDTDALVGLSAALRGQGDGRNAAKWEEARRLLAQVLDREPNHVAAQFNMGVLCTEFLKCTKEGVGHLRRFLEDAPDAHPSRPEAERLIKAFDGASAPAAPVLAPGSPSGSSPGPETPPAARGSEGGKR
jgi:cytochrome c-type biogenesis protein CcmH/NrfG